MLGASTPDSWVRCSVPEEPKTFDLTRYSTVCDIYGPSPTMAVTVESMTAALRLFWPSALDAALGAGNKATRELLTSLDEPGSAGFRRLLADYGITNRATVFLLARFACLAGLANLLMACLRHLVLLGCPRAMFDAFVMLLPICPCARLVLLFKSQLSPAGQALAVAYIVATNDVRLMHEIGVDWCRFFWSFGDGVDGLLARRQAVAYLDVSPEDTSPMDAKSAALNLDRVLFAPGHAALGRPIVPRTLLGCMAAQTWAPEFTDKAVLAKAKLMLDNTAANWTTEPETRAAIMSVMQYTDGPVSVVHGVALRNSPPLGLAVGGTTLSIKHRGRAVVYVTRSAKGQVVWLVHGFADVDPAANQAMLAAHPAAPTAQASTVRLHQPI